MKTTSMKVLLTVATLAIFGSSFANAYDRDRNYSYGHNGYWDHHRHYHHWERYHDHDGYWYNRPDGVRVFIDI